MKKYILLTLLTCTVGMYSCNDQGFLDKQPKNILLDSQVWSSPELILAVVADLYDRYPDGTCDIPNIQNWAANTMLGNEAFASANGDYWRHDRIDYDWGFPNCGAYWDYGYVRDLNIFLQNCSASTSLKAEDKARFLAEVRFLRAAMYFTAVKTEGGVPLVLEPLTYDFSGDPTYLQKARSKEADLYDFILKELDAIKNDLPKGGTQTRATWGLVLAMKARVALYAASIAKYGATTPAVKLPGGEVGIEPARAVGYYEVALAAAEELIKSNSYSLYKKYPTDLQNNFASLFLDKNANPEVIFAKDYKLKTTKTHGWTQANQPRYQAEEQEGGRLNPSLNLVQSFEKLDGTFAPFTQTNADGFIVDHTGKIAYFNSPSEIFANRDARLWGTVILPGTQFKGKDVDIWAGHYNMATNTVISGSNFGQTGKLPNGQEAQLVGFSGPIDELEFSAQTGFYIRKYMDPAPGSGQRGVRSEVWWIRYRYAEVLLNAAEAAFELGKPDAAAGYLNQVRQRAGITKNLLAADVSFDRIVHERKVELAFEDHSLWDMKRWRIAHLVLDGVSKDLTSRPDKATESNTRPFGLWPYKVYDPSGALTGKWVFKKVLPKRVRQPRRFRLGNYYTHISDDIISHNPKIVRNPNQN